MAQKLERKQPAAKRLRGRSSRRAWHSEQKLALGTANYVVFALALLCIVVGFVLLANNSLTLAPLLLVIGYSILIPISLLLGVGEGKAKEAEGGERQEAT